MEFTPSMVQRSGDKLIVRRVVSGEQVHLNESPTGAEAADEGGESSGDQQLLDGWRRELGGAALRTLDESAEDTDATSGREQQQLPQCKIKRNYSCGRCAYFTQNPREYLMHLRDTHGEKIVINECKRCLYASRHYQKLVRHMKMVHGSVDGIRKSAFGSRRRGQKGYGGGGGGVGGLHVSPVPKMLRSSDTDQLTTAYMYQLVASGLPKLLEEIEKPGAGTSLAAVNFDRNSLIHLDLEQLNKPLPYSPGKTIHQEASEGDRADATDGGDGRAKKRSRPVPNLIPLNVSPSPSSSAASATLKAGQKFMKAVPLSALLTAEGEEADRAGQEFPISLTKHPKAPMTSAPEEPLLATKCMYCELTFKTVESLANHIKLAHKDDLIAYLLANSLEEASAKGLLRSQTEASGRTSSDAWSRAETEGATVQSQPSNDDSDEEGRDDGPPHQSQTFCGVETAPGYGEVTNRIPTVDPASGTGLMKKVFKCPHCSFWASTASRFHVHIVGHLNKKPFECSLCAYRSNWRWDITKHIRLKTIRDPSHKNAGVLMNDETGRRNYTKYNRYIALMQIADK